MTDPSSPFYGRNINEIAAICGVDLTTARRWKRGARRPPKSAILLISGDLGIFDPAWRGWIVRRGQLISPEGWEITTGEVLAVPLMRLQIAAYQRDLRAQQAALSSQEQPLPEAWPEWVHGIRTA